MRAKLIVPALAMLGLSGFVVLTTRSLPYWADYAPGPAFTPRWVAATIVLLALPLLWRGMRPITGEVAGSANEPAGAKVLLVGGSLVAFAGLAPVLGALIASIAFLGFLLLVVLRQQLLPSTVATVATVAIVFGIFQFWLGIRLPVGPFGI